MNVRLDVESVFDWIDYTIQKFDYGYFEIRNKRVWCHGFKYIASDSILCDLDWFITKLENYAKSNGIYPVCFHFPGTVESSYMYIIKFNDKIYKIIRSNTDYRFECCTDSNLEETVSSDIIDLFDFADNKCLKNQNLIELNVSCIKSAINNLKSLGVTPRSISVLLDELNEATN